MFGNFFDGMAKVLKRDFSGTPAKRIIVHEVFTTRRFTNTDSREQAPVQTVLVGCGNEFVTITFKWHVAFCKVSVKTSSAGIRNFGTNLRSGTLAETSVFHTRLFGICDYRTQT